jgi:periplasmic divalent cation tolerance protein
VRFSESRPCGRALYALYYLLTNWKADGNACGREFAGSRSPRSARRLFRNCQRLGVQATMVISVSTTVDKREVLEQIGRKLLEKRLVACVQISGPLKSVYWWKGCIEEADEWIGVMKTRSELYSEVEKEVKALHPYDVPEIVAVEVRNLSHTYEKWVLDETGGSTAPVSPSGT